jgi:hypothetical protein
MRVVVAHVGDVRLLCAASPRGTSGRGAQALPEPCRRAGSRRHVDLWTLGLASCEPLSLACRERRNVLIRAAASVGLGSWGVNFALRMMRACGVAGGARDTLGLFRADIERGRAPRARSAINRHRASPPPRACEQISDVDAPSHQTSTSRPDCRSRIWSSIRLAIAYRSSRAACSGVGCSDGDGRPIAP